MMAVGGSPLLPRVVMSCLMLCAVLLIMAIPVMDRTWSFEHIQKMLPSTETQMGIAGTSDLISQEQLSVNAIGYVQDDEIPSTQDVTEDSTFCSIDERMKLRTKVCRDMERYNSVGDTIEYLLIDNVHRAVWTIIPKAGSRSWLSFFVRSIGQKGQIEKERSRFRRLGLNFTSRVSISEYNTRYQNYTKFIVVRHPLQKLVSGYYEVIVTREKYRSECRKIRQWIGEKSPDTCSKEPMLSLTEFSRAFANGLLPENEHWASQLLLGKTCRTNLDLILKSETDETDVKLLSKILGIQGRKVGISHQHSRNMGMLRKALPNKISLDLTKYDLLLSKLQKNSPDTFNWLLDYFKPDMDMFGYTWNSTSASSGCDSYPVSSCC